MKKLISIIIPVCNESLNIGPIYQEISLAMAKIKEDFSYEIIFINDGSTDDSVKNVEGLISQDNQVRLKACHW